MSYSAISGRRSLALATVLSGGLLFSAYSAVAAPTTVDFTSFQGDNVLGEGTVVSILNIKNDAGNGVGLVEGEKPATYGAPNGTTSEFNGGIGPLGGFADTLNKSHQFVFEFSEPVAYFQLRVLDFGDFNPDNAKSHTFGITASNGDTKVGTQSVTFESDGSVNPGKPTGLYLTGDAVRAEDDDPGNVLFQFDEPFMTSFKLFYDSDKDLTGPTDPNIAFSDLAFTAVGGSAEIPVPGSLGLLAAGLIGLGYSMRSKR
jgi:hypothetical protein